MQDIHNNAADILILGVDSSSKSGCAAVSRGGQVLAAEFENSGLTHSQTLMPLIKRAVDKAKVKIKDVSIIAITTGPGSFTGLRIGLASVKGIAAVNGAECIGLSSLEAAAQGVVHDGVICAVMDARCKRVYNALFERRNGVLERLCDDRTIEIESLCNELKSLNRPVMLTGDAARLCVEQFRNVIDGIEAVPENQMYIHGESICALALRKLAQSCNYKSLNPKYIQLPQAQRELIAKQKESV